MADVISEYQRWKQQGADLRVQAKQAIETRYRDLLIEAVRLAEEYRADFGSTLKPPAPVTSFRYKAVAHKAKKKGAPPAKSAAKAPEPPAAAAKPNPKVMGLQKRLMTAKKKLDDAKTAGGVTRVLEDKIYEIEDELRLAQQ
ncbi:MAG TPA: hypothetical protein VG456_05385 [Candidatus Sulfopaludibacter sp.]|jgi:hypothetical protein|nr:hypothetical protein [Candidatus Sulfopaludibacter sp.]